jgi:2-polyprenyl-6-methoxyphenol hydroxylase-like FAD-dependent oxidoreductase
MSAVPASGCGRLRLRSWRSSGTSDPAQVIYGPIEEVILLPPWYRQRVRLIGDAAHASGPHVSQGATMAIEDASVPAELIGRGLSGEEVLAQFMARRYERCKFVQDTSRLARIAAPHRYSLLGSTTIVPVMCG